MKAASRRHSIVMDRKENWESVYADRPDDQLSWHQAVAQPSLRLILDAVCDSAWVIDIGGGSSALVDRLLDFSFSRIAVLDISRTALGRSRAHLGQRAERIEWIEADVCGVWSMRFSRGRQAMSPGPTKSPRRSGQSKSESPSTARPDWDWFNQGHHQAII